MPTRIEIYPNRDRPKSASRFKKFKKSYSKVGKVAA